MRWDDEIDMALPQPAPDDPADLRDDIRDELADHLTCSMNRELLRDGDERRAETRVLDRFGDPGKLARRLWWDSTKGQMMNRKLRIAAVTTCVLAAGVGMFAMLYIAEESSARVAGLTQHIQLLQQSLSRQSQTLSELAAQIGKSRPETSDAAYGGSSMMEMMAASADNGGMGTGYPGGGYAGGSGGFDSGMSPMMMGGGMSAGGYPGAVSAYPGVGAARDSVQTQQSAKVQELLASLFPDSKIQVVYLKDSVVLRGTVNSAEASEQVEEITKQFFETTLNQLHLGSSTDTPPANEPALEAAAEAEISPEEN
ncbi:MAG: hypothetical protein R3C19_25560 [Planctomycetaceae bacterium]